MRRGGAQPHFGSEVIAVNVLMGNPADELPASNVEALCGFFDANLLPRNDCSDPTQRELLADLEASALEIAGDDDVEKVESALPGLVAEHEAAISVLAEMLEETLEDAAIEERLVPIWENEQERIEDLGAVDGDLAPAPPYKRPILQSLYLTDEHFEELLQAQDPNAVSDELKAQLKATGLVEEEPSRRGPTLKLQPGLRLFLEQEDEARELRGLCEARLEENEAMYWFFQDIRDQERRERMVSVFINLVEKGGAGAI